MEKINNEYYVSLEVAKLLKEAGFKWSIRGAYMDGKFVFQENSLCDNFNGKQYENGTIHEFFSSPTLDVAQRWLREVMNIDVYIFPDTNVKRECVYQVGLKTFGRTLWMPGQPSTAQYNTYEEAQESGIKKAVELILEKGE